MTRARGSRELAQLAVAYLGFVLLGISASAGGVLLPRQIDDYGVDKTTIGLLFVAFTIGYTSAAMANGTLAHRFGIRTLLVVCASAMLGGSILLALRPGFVAFVAVQVAFGFGTGGIDAGLNVYLSTLDRSTALLNSLHAFFGAGAIIGPILAAGLVSRLPWGWFFAVFAVLLVPLLVGLIAVYPRGRAALDAAAQRPRLSAALRLSVVWLGGAFLALYVGLEVGVGNWGFSFLTEDRGQGIMLAGWAMSGYWTGLMLGRFVLGRLADRIGLGAVGLNGWCLAFVVVAAMGAWLVPSGAAAAACLAILGFFLGPLFPTMISAMPNVTPARLAATAIGVLVGLSAVGGALAPWAAGAVAQRLGAWSLFPFSVLLTVALGAIWWRIARRIAAHAAATPAPRAAPAIPSAVARE